MDIFKTFLYIALVVFCECKVIEFGNKDKNGKSLVEIVQQLVTETGELKKVVRALHVHNQKLTTDNEKLKTEVIEFGNKDENGKSLVEIVQQLVTETVELKKVVRALTTDNEKLKTEMALLTKNGHLEYSVADQQWQSLHMAAAAGCRGSTALGGHGHHWNTVYPRTEGHNCVQVCAATKYYTECDASLSIHGIMGQIKKPNYKAAWYYNYGCEGFGNAADETISSDMDVINSKENYFKFCCCRNGDDV